MELDCITGLVALKEREQIVGAVDVAAVELLDDVARDDLSICQALRAANTCLRGGRIRLHAQYRYAGHAQLLRDRLAQAFGKLNAQPRADDFSMRDQLRDDPVDVIDGDGKSDSRRRT